jgi:serine/threonine protein kinase
MAETGRVIGKRYQLGRLIKRGQLCTVYQGFDEVLPRVVAVKVIPAVHIPAYRAAIRATSSFSHPNIVGTYDLVVESEILYLVQEYVDGNDFRALLQAQLSPYEVADLGVQICEALLYAGSPPHCICHGDLTPSAVIRDRRGLVRVNNFALPCDLYYFTGWSIVGGDGPAVSDQQLPWGQQTEGRRADDTRALGLLLYQLLTPRPPGATMVEPPANGQLRFLRTTPAELCEIIARAIARQHPEHITTPEVLYTELKAVAEMLEPTTPAAASPDYSTEDMPDLGHLPSPGLPSPPGTGNLAQAHPQAHPVREAAAVLMNPSPNSLEPQIAAIEHAPAAPTVADIPVKLVAARQAAYPDGDSAPRRLNFPALLFIGMILFILFFAVGYYLATIVVHR